MGKAAKIEWIDDRKKGCLTALFCFPFPKNSRFMPSGKRQKNFFGIIQWMLLL